jgi:hypothetical protein
LSYLVVVDIAKDSERNVRNGRFQFTVSLLDLSSSDAMHPDAWLTRDASNSLVSASRTTLTLYTATDTDRADWLYMFWVSACTFARGTLDAKPVLVEKPAHTRSVSTPMLFGRRPSTQEGSHSLPAVEHGRDLLFSSQRAKAKLQMTASFTRVAEFLSETAARLADDKDDPALEAWRRLREAGTRVAQLPESDEPPPRDAELDSALRIILGVTDAPPSAGSAAAAPDVSRNALTDLLDEEAELIRRIYAGGGVSGTAEASRVRRTLSMTPLSLSGAPPVRAPDEKTLEQTIQHVREDVTSFVQGGQRLLTSVICGRPAGKGHGHEREHPLLTSWVAAAIEDALLGRCGDTVMELYTMRCHGKDAMVSRASSRVRQQTLRVMGVAPALCLDERPGPGYDAALAELRRLGQGALRPQEQIQVVLGVAKSICTCVDAANSKPTAAVMSVSRARFCVRVWWGN